MGLWGSGKVYTFTILTGAKRASYSDSHIWLIITELNASVIKNNSTTGYIVVSNGVWLNVGWRAVSFTTLLRWIRELFTAMSTSMRSSPEPWRSRRTSSVCSWWTLSYLVDAGLAVWVSLALDSPVCSASQWSYLVSFSISLLVDLTRRCVGIDHTSLFSW